MKLCKLLQSQGIGSRKECMTLIAKGRVSVNGEILRNAKAEVEASLGFSVDETFYSYAEKMYVALYKPAGYECSHNPQHHKSVYSLLPAHLLKRGVESAGRLDADTTGLLLFSDDGQFIHKVMSPKKECRKVYEVHLKHALTNQALRLLQDGVVLRDSPYPVAAVRAEAISDKLLRLEIKEGKYHQVKRMVAAISNRVIFLHRVSVGGLTLDNLDLKEGHFLVLKKEHLEKTELYDKCTITL